MRFSLAITLVLDPLGFRIWGAACWSTPLSNVRPFKSFMACSVVQKSLLSLNI